MAKVSGDQKQKLFILAAFLGVLVLVGFFAMRTHSGPDETATDASLTAGAPAVAGAPTAAQPPAKEQVKIAKAPEKKPEKEATAKAANPKAPDAKSGAAKAADGKTPAGKPVAAKPPVGKPATAKAPVVAPVRGARLEPSRSDPFEAFYYATPEPPPTPTPTPPPVQLPPPPVQLPSPRLALAPPNTVLIGLPRPRVAGYAPLPGPIWVRSGGAPKAPSDIQIRSANKRLSGVIIGDSVRALLEISTGEAAGGAAGDAGGAAAAQTIVRVVQPGDEVDGIKILRIERVYEGGRQITRMFIREGNEERFVDLRPSPNPPAAAAAGGVQGEGGPPAPPGGTFGTIRPVGPGGFQRQPRNPVP